MMVGLDVSDPRYVGAVRGEAGLERTQVRVGVNYGVDSTNVSEELGRFYTKLQAMVLELDGLDHGIYASSCKAEWVQKKGTNAI